MTTGTSHDRLFFRHAMERKRQDGYRALRLLRRPFESNGGCSSGCWESASTYPLRNERPPEPKSLVVGRFPNQQWLSLFALGCSHREILDAHRTVSRLEFLRIRLGPRNELTLVEVIKKGETMLRFEKFDDSTFQTEGFATENDAEPDIDQVVAAIRRQLSFKARLRTLEVTVAGEAFQVVNELGNVLKPQLSAYAVLDGPFPIEKPELAQQLADALDSLDVSAVQMALERGASVERTLDSSLSPLRCLLHEIENKDGYACAQALISAGASFDGLLVSCFDGIYTTDQSLAAARLLIDNGANVDEVTSNGATPLFGAVCQGNLEAVTLLLSHGADPDSTVPHEKKTLSQWVRDRCETTTTQTELRLFASLLTQLTGEELPMPEPPVLPPEFQRENDRFRTALQAQQTLASLPISVRVEPGEVDKLTNHPRFQELDEVLRESGFVLQGHYHDDFGVPKPIVAYTHPTLNLDAVVQDYWWVPFVGCRILGYGTDGKLFACSNSDLQTEDEPTIPCLTALEFPNAPPAMLVAEMQSLLEKEQATTRVTPPEEFLTRFTEGYDLVLEQTRQAFRKRLATDVIEIKGEPAVFERRQLYLDFSSWDNPSYCSATLARESENSVMNCEETDFDQVCYAVREAYYLLAMQQMQYEGAPRENDFLQCGCELAVQLFEDLRAKWKREISYSLLQPLWQSLILCQIAEARGLLSSDSFVRICNAVQPRMATRELRGGGDLPLALGQWSMVFVSGFRKRAISKLDDWRSHVDKSRSKRARRLLAATDAWHAQDQHGFESNLSVLVNELAFPKSRSDQFANDLAACFATPESLLYNAAILSGLEVELPQDVTDCLIHP